MYIVNLFFAPMCTISTGEITFDRLFFVEKDKSRGGGSDHILEC